MKRLLISVLISIPVTILLLIGSGMAGGACHCATIITLLFPYGTILGTRTSWESTGFWLTLLQFPLYAAIVASVRNTRLMLVVMLLLHAVAAFLGFTVSGL